MCRYLIAGEDHRLRYHPGVDPIAMCRAVWSTLFIGSRQGGSTIAMQFVRTVTGRYDNTCRRKLCEIILAVYLTLRFGRLHLPKLYLWVAYYGWGMNNFLHACERLNLDPDNLGELETAEFVARLKYPEPRSLTSQRRRQIRARARHLIACTRNGRGIGFSNWIKRNGALQDIGTFSGSN